MQNLIIVGACYFFIFVSVMGLLFDFSNQIMSYSETENSVTKELFLYLMGKKLFLSMLGFLIFFIIISL